VSCLFHPWLAIRIQLVLGGLLVIASWHKIADPPDFAKIVYNYRLLPAAMINITAIYMPWLELFTGAALFLGIWRRGASFIAGMLMLAFIAALSYNLARGCPTICGCFDTHAASQSLTDAEKFTKMRREIGLDVGLLLLAAHVFIASFRAGKPLQAAAP
jgi:uncharacterized membrane protein YphA (DoxX/SURF4 family)